MERLIRHKSYCMRRTLDVKKLEKLSKCAATKKLGAYLTRKKMAMASQAPHGGGRTGVVGRWERWMATCRLLPRHERHYAARALGISDRPTIPPKRLRNPL